jgi:hypothetical protein
LIEILRSFVMIKFVSLAVVAAAVLAVIPAPLSAHPGHARHAKILKYPPNGVRNEDWYDYREDIADADHDLSDDLRDARSQRARRKAFARYSKEILQARRKYARDRRD